MEYLSEMDAARLVYLGLLIVILGSYMLVAMRRQIGTVVRYSLLWALLFTGAIAAYGLWQTMPMGMLGVQQNREDAIEIQRSFDGQFHLSMEIEGAEGSGVQTIRFILDTGASDLVLTRDDARKLGFAPEDLLFLGSARTANGVTGTARVRLSRVMLGGLESTNVSALVNEGELHSSLLGMAYLRRFSRIEIIGDRMRLEY